MLAHSVAAYEVVTVCKTKASASPPRWSLFTFFLLATLPFSSHLHPPFQSLLPLSIPLLLFLTSPTYPDSQWLRSRRPSPTSSTRSRAPPRKLPASPPPRSSRPCRRSTPMPGKDKSLPSSTSSRPPTSPGYSTSCPPLTLPASTSSPKRPSTRPRPTRPPPPSSPCLPPRPPPSLTPTPPT